MLGTLGRIFFGFTLACLTAALIMVLHVFTPVDFFKAGPGTFATNATNAALLTLLAATHTAIFASAFALIAAGVAEYLQIRSIPYYVLAGAVITVLGFIAQFSSETAGQATIFNNYALRAFVTAGLVSGLVYWFAAGRYAGRSKLETDKAWTNGVTVSSNRNSALPKIEIAERAAKAVNRASSHAAKVAKEQKLEETAPGKPAIKADTTSSGSVPSTKSAAAKAEDATSDDSGRKS